MTEPTDEDLTVAYECLRKVPFNVSPVVHLGRIIASYRERIEHKNAVGMSAEGGEGPLWAAQGDADHG